MAWATHASTRLFLETIMKVPIRKVGNAQGVVIPKSILAQVGLEHTADMRVRKGVIEIRPVRRNPREGWSQHARRLAEHGEDTLVWPEFANDGDDTLIPPGCLRAPA